MTKSKNYPSTSLPITFNIFDTYVNLFRKQVKLTDRGLLWIVISFMAFNMITGTQLDPDIWYKRRHSVLDLWYGFFWKCQATIWFLTVRRIVGVHHAKLSSKSMWAESWTENNPHYNLQQVWRTGAEIPRVETFRIVPSKSRYLVASSYAIGRTFCPTAHTH